MENNFEKYEDSINKTQYLSKIMNEIAAFGSMWTDNEEDTRSIITILSELSTLHSKYLDESLYYLEEFKNILR